MIEESKAGTPRWILIATAAVGLVAAIFVAGARYYEFHKARTEAANAQATPAGEKPGTNTNRPPKQETPKTTPKQEAPKTVPKQEVPKTTPNPEPPKPVPNPEPPKTAPNPEPPNTIPDPEPPKTAPKQEPPKPAANDWKQRFPVGKYACSYSLGGKATIELKSDGTFHRIRGGGVDPVSEGKLEFKNGQLIIRGGSEYVEVWYVEDGEIRLNHWYPANIYPKNLPKETATVSRTKP